MAHTLDKDMANIKINSKLGATYAEKKSSGNIGNQLNFVTNLTKLDVQRNIVFYKYDVNMDIYFKYADGTLNEKPKSLTKGGQKNDHVANKRKAKCVSVMDHLTTNEAAFFNINDPGQILVYDRQAVCFTTKQLAVDPENGTTFQLPATLASSKPDAARLDVTIKKVTENFQCSSNDFARAVNIRPDMADKGFLEVVNLMLSQIPFKNPNWVTFGACNHYMREPPRQLQGQDLQPLEENMAMTLGVSKSVKVLEGNQKDKPTVYAVTEVKKAAIHNPDDSLVAKVHEMVGHRGPQQSPKLAPNSYDARIVGEKLKDLTVYINYGPDKEAGEPKVFVIGRVNGLAADSPQTGFTSTNGNQYRSIADYYQRKYGIKLRYSSYFMVGPKTPMAGGMKLWFPMECLGVCDSQRVKKNQESIRNQATIIRASAALPEKRLNQTRLMKEEIGLNPNSPALKKIGMIAEPNFAQVNGRVLPQPGIVYAPARNQNHGQPVNADLKNGKWQTSRGASFFRPKKIPTWLWICLYQNAPAPVNDAVVDDYYGRLMGMMRSFGMQAEEADVWRYGRPTASVIESIFQDAKSKGIKYLFFVSDDSVKMHDEIKAAEQRHGVLTQEVRKSKVREVIEKGRNETLQNVIMKINQKCGGLNHNVTAAPLLQSLRQNLKQSQAPLDLPLSNPQCLIVGFEMSSTASDIPVLGFAGNTAAELQYFRGDYRFYDNDPKKRDRVARLMAEALSFMINEQLFKARVDAKKQPVGLKQCLIYINGPSEGSFGELITRFVPEFESKLPRGVALTLIVASKSHNERIFSSRINPAEKATGQNIPSGSVVDSVIVSPVLTEFYLTPHQAFQGTAKPVKYTVVYDRNGYSIDTLEANTFALSFMHGIVNLATSLPVPLLVADRMAKRGRNNLKTTEHGDLSANDVDRLNEQLTYANSPLKMIRFNA